MIKKSESGAKKTLVICSYGLKPAHATLETLAELRGCDTVYCVGLNETAGKLVKNNCRRITFINSQTIPRQISGIMRSFRKNNRVGMITYGHPVFFSRLTNRLLAHCRKKHIHCRIIEAVSSFGAVCTVLLEKLGYFPEAICAVSVPSVPASKIQVYPQLPTLFFDLGNPVGTSSSTRIREFGLRLKSKYPPSHELYLIECPSVVSKTARCEKFRVSDMGRPRLRITAGTTVFIPEVGPGRFGKKPLQFSDRNYEWIFNP